MPLGFFNKSCKLILSPSSQPSLTQLNSFWDRCILLTQMYRELFNKALSRFLSLSPPSSPQACFASLSHYNVWKQETLLSFKSNEEQIFEQLLLSESIWTFVVAQKYLNNYSCLKYLNNNFQNCVRHGLGHFGYWNSVERRLHFHDIRVKFVSAHSAVGTHWNHLGRLQKEEEQGWARRNEEGGAPWRR